MKTYTKLYMKALGYEIGDYIPSEFSGTPGVDIIHIIHRGVMGGKCANFIENLMAATRNEHMRVDKKAVPQISQLRALETHIAFLEQNGVPVDYEKVEWLRTQIT